MSDCLLPQVHLLTQDRVRVHPVQCINCPVSNKCWYPSPMVSVLMAMPQKASSLLLFVSFLTYQATFYPPFWMPDLQLCSSKGRKSLVQKRFIPAVVGRRFSKSLSDKALLWTWIVAVPVSHTSRSQLDSLARKILPFCIHRRKNFSHLSMLRMKTNYSNVMSHSPMLPSSRAENFRNKTLN